MSRLSVVFACSLLVAWAPLTSTSCSSDPGGVDGGGGGDDVCQGSDCVEPGDTAGGEAMDACEGVGCDDESPDAGSAPDEDGTSKTDGGGTTEDDAASGDTAGDDPVACTVDPDQTEGPPPCALERCWSEPECIDYHLEEFVTNNQDLAEGDLDDYERCGGVREFDASMVRDECEQEPPSEAFDIDPADGAKCDVVDVTMEVKFWCPPAPDEGETDALLASVRADTVKPKPEVLEQTEDFYHMKAWHMEIEPLRSWAHDGDLLRRRYAGMQNSSTWTYGLSTTQGERTPAGALVYHWLPELETPDDITFSGRFLFEHREQQSDFSDPDNPQVDEETLGKYWVGGFSTGPFAMSDLRDAQN